MPYEHDAVNNAARHSRRSRRLGPDARCLLCPQTDPRALSHYPRVVLEEHHVVARLNDNELTVVLCRSCHAIETDRQRDAGVANTSTQAVDVLDRISQTL